VKKHQSFGIHIDKRHLINSNLVSPASAQRNIKEKMSAAASARSCENLPPRTLARLAREVRDLYTNPPEGLRLVVDNDSGLPGNLGELTVCSMDSCFVSGECCVEE
jgi:hypothetical protein